eukprot:gene48606-59520_t
MTTVKFVLDNEIRRVTIGEDGRRVSFDSIRLVIKELFPSLKDAAFVLQWTDEEGDIVSMSTENELQEALRSSKLTGRVLRLTVAPKTPSADHVTPNTSSTSAEAVKYGKLRAMLGVGPVRQKMAADGFTPAEVEEFLRSGALPVVRTPLPMSSEDMARYARMRQVHGDGVVRQRMNVDGVSERDQE